MAHSRWRAVVAPLLLLIAGLCIVRAQSLTWAAADALDGTRYKLSPTVLLHVFEPSQLQSPTVECGLGVVRSRSIPACQFGPAAETAVQRLSGAALLLYGSSVWAVGTALLLLRQVRHRYRRVLAAVVAGVLAVVATALFRPAALELLTSVGAVNGGFGGMGWYLVHLAPLLAGVAAVLEWQRREHASSAAASAVVLGFAAVFACVLLLAPRPLGNSVALLTSAGGLTVGLGLALLDLAGRLVRPRLRPAG